MKDKVSLAKGSRSTLLKVAFRPASPSDIDSVMSVECESFPPGIRETRKLFLERIMSFPKGFLLISIDGGNIIGYISSELWSMNSDPTARSFALGHSIRKTHAENGNMLYVSSMGILGKYRSLGLGRRLFKTLLANIYADLSSVSSIVLIVGTSWRAARKIYRTEGFRNLFIIEEFFKPTGMPSFDGIVMKKNLKRSSR